VAVALPWSAGAGRLLSGYQSTHHTVISSLGQLVTGAFFFTQSSRHTVKSSHGHLITSQHCTNIWVGAQTSVGMQILMVATNVQNLGAPAPDP